MAGPRVKEGVVIIMSTKYLSHLGLMSEMVMVETEGRVMIYCCGRGNGGKGEGEPSEEGPNMVFAAVCAVFPLPGSDPFSEAKAAEQRDGRMDGGWAAESACCPRLGRLHILDRVNDATG